MQLGFSACGSLPPKASSGIGRSKPMSCTARSPTEPFLRNQENAGPRLYNIDLHWPGRNGIYSEFCHDLHYLWFSARWSTERVDTKKHFQALTQDTLILQFCSRKVPRRVFPKELLPKSIFYMAYIIHMCFILYITYIFYTIFSTWTSTTSSTSSTSSTQSPSTSSTYHT